MTTQTQGPAADAPADPCARCRHFAAVIDAYFAACTRARMPAARPESGYDASADLARPWPRLRDAADGREGGR